MEENATKSQVNQQTRIKYLYCTAQSIFLNVLSVNTNHYKIKKKKTNKSRDKHRNIFFFLKKAFKH